MFEDWLSIRLGEYALLRAWVLRYSEAMNHIILESERLRQHCEIEGVDSQFLEDPEQDLGPRYLIVTTQSILDFVLYLKPP